MRGSKGRVGGLARCLERYSGGRHVRGMHRSTGFMYVLTVLLIAVHIDCYTY